MNAYLANAWYELQLQLHRGSRLYEQGGFHTVDWGYTAGLFGDLERATKQTEPLRRLVFTYASWEAHDSSVGPEKPNAPSWAWNLRDAVLPILDADRSLGKGDGAILETALSVWLEKSGQFAVEQWLQTDRYAGANFYGPDWVVGSGTGEQNDRSEADGFWKVAHVAAGRGDVHGAVLGGLANFGKALWPRNDWDAMRPGAPTAIAAPTGVGATAGVESATVRWDATPGAASYNVLRATQAGGPYLTVALLRTETSFVDTWLDPAQSYHYVVTANVDRYEGPPSGETSVTPARGLVSRWTFADADPAAAADRGGFANHGGLIGAATKVAGPGAHAAIALDGKSGWLSVRHSLHRWLGTSATLTAWLRTTYRAGAHSYDLYAKLPGLAARAGGGVDETYWGVIDEAGRLGLGGFGLPASGWAWTTTTVADGTWHHVALSRDQASGALAVFVDGAPAASAVGDTKTYASRIFAVGRTEGNDENLLPGAIGDVRLYDRALTAAEIAAIAKE